MTTRWTLSAEEEEEGEEEEEPLRRRRRSGFARTHACTHTRSCEIDLMYECVHARTHGFLLEKAPRVIPALKS